MTPFEQHLTRALGASDTETGEVVTGDEYVTLVGRITGNEVDGYLVQILENDQLVDTVYSPGGAYDPREFRTLKQARRALDGALRREARRRETAFEEVDEMRVRIR